MTEPTTATRGDEADCWLSGSQAVAILNIPRRVLLDLVRNELVDSHVDATGRRVYSARSVQAHQARMADAEARS